MAPVNTDRMGVEIVRFASHAPDIYPPILWHVVDNHCGGAFGAQIAAVACVVEIPHGMCQHCLPELARRIAVRA